MLTGLNFFIYIQGKREDFWLLCKEIHSEVPDIAAKAQPIFSTRLRPSLAGFKEKYIFASGGKIEETGEVTAEVFQYRVSTDSWTIAPALNQGRQMHSSCVVDNSIYVCGGTDGQHGHLESIERLPFHDQAGVNDESTSHWETLNIATPRFYNFLMVPITSSEILFLGGYRAG